MDYNNIEVAVIEEAQMKASKEAAAELMDLQLAYSTGGMGTTVL